MDLVEVLLTGPGCPPRVLEYSGPWVGLRGPHHFAGWQVSVGRMVLNVVAGQHVETLSGRAKGAGTQRDLGGKKGCG